MLEYLLISIALSVGIYVEGTRAGLARNDVIAWTVLVALFGLFAVPFYLWWRARWNRQHGIVAPEYTGRVDATGWKKLIVVFAVALVAIVVLGWLAIVL